VKAVGLTDLHVRGWGRGGVRRRRRRIRGYSKQATTCRATWTRMPWTFSHNFWFDKEEEEHNIREEEEVDYLMHADFRVMEKDHKVILNWSQWTVPILRQIAGGVRREEEGWNER
jgi:hypothetical protein